MPSSDGLLLGRYWLDREIASGGMASVHYGRLLGPVGFSRTVAIKRMHAHMAKDWQFVSMFVDEARLTTRVQHPNVVSVLDVVATEGELFLVMEYVNGESLVRLTEGGRPPPSVTCAIMLGVLEGLHAAHEATDGRGEPLRLVHRDISPQNVLVGVDGIPRIADFGIAKAASRILTTGAAGGAKGKLLYMAPEQLLGEEVDRRADVWAAGVLLVELLTGRRLFERPNSGAVVQAVLEGAVLRPGALAPALGSLDPVAMRALSRSPAERFATAREMATALAASHEAATNRQVGEWVERTAWDSLARSRVAIQEMEASAPSGGPSVRTQVAQIAARAGTVPEAAASDAARPVALPLLEDKDKTIPAGGRSAKREPTAGETGLQASSVSPEPTRGRRRAVGAAISGIVGLVTVGCGLYVFVAASARRSTHAEPSTPEAASRAVAAAQPATETPALPPAASAAGPAAPAASPAAEASVAPSRPTHAAAREPRRSPPANASAPAPMSSSVVPQTTDRAQLGSRK